MKHLIALFVLASIAIVGCSDNSSQEPVSASTSDTPLPLSKEGTPYRLTVHGFGSQDIPAPVQCPPLPGYTPTGSRGIGHSTALGPFTIFQGHCSNPQGGTDNGFAELTFRNGDILIGRYTSWVVGGTFPVFNFEGVATYNSEGTGRFANTTGEGTVTGTVSVVPPYEYTVNIVGTLVHR
jgi:hypothetical protein